MYTSVSGSNVADQTGSGSVRNLNIGYYGTRISSAPLSVLAKRSRRHVYVRAGPYLPAKASLASIKRLTKTQIKEELVSRQNQFDGTKEDMAKELLKAMEQEKPQPAPSNPASKSSKAKATPTSSSKTAKQTSEEKSAKETVKGTVKLKTQKATTQPQQKQEVPKDSKTTGSAQKTKDEKISATSKPTSKVAEKVKQVMAKSKAEEQTKKEKSEQKKVEKTPTKVTSTKAVEKEEEERQKSDQPRKVVVKKELRNQMVGARVYVDPKFAPINKGKVKQKEAAQKPAQKEVKVSSKAAAVKLPSIPKEEVKAQEKEVPSKKTAEKPKEVVKAKEEEKEVAKPKPKQAVSKKPEPKPKEKIEGKVEKVPEEQKETEIANKDALQQLNILLKKKGLDKVQAPWLLGSGPLGMGQFKTLADLEKYCGKAYTLDILFESCKAIGAVDFTKRSKRTQLMGAIWKVFEQAAAAKPQKKEEERKDMKKEEKGDAKKVAVSAVAQAEKKEEESKKSSGRGVLEEVKPAEQESVPKDKDAYATYMSNKYKKDDLAKMCSEAGLAKSGTKNELIALLWSHEFGKGDKKGSAKKEEGREADLKRKRRGAAPKIVDEEDITLEEEYDAKEMDVEEVEAKFDDQPQDMVDRPEGGASVFQEPLEDRRSTKAALEGKEDMDYDYHENQRDFSLMDSTLGYEAFSEDDIDIEDNTSSKTGEKVVWTKQDSVDFEMSIPETVDLVGEDTLTGVQNLQIEQEIMTEMEQEELESELTEEISKEEKEKEEEESKTEPKQKKKVKSKQQTKAASIKPSKKSSRSQKSKASQQKAESKNVEAVDEKDMLEEDNVFNLEDYQKKSMGYVSRTPDIDDTDEEEYIEVESPPTETGPDLIADTQPQTTKSPTPAYKSTESTRRFNPPPKNLTTTFNRSERAGYEGSKQSKGDMTTEQKTKPEQFQQTELDQIDQQNKQRTLSDDMLKDVGVQQQEPDLQKVETTVLLTDVNRQDAQTQSPSASEDEEENQSQATTIRADNVVEKNKTGIIDSASTIEDVSFKQQQQQQADVESASVREKEEVSIQHSQKFQISQQTAKEDQDVDVEQAAQVEQTKQNKVLSEDATVQTQVKKSETTEDSSEKTEEDVSSTMKISRGEKESQQQSELDKMMDQAKQFFKGLFG